MSWAGSGGFRGQERGQGLTRRRGQALGDRQEVEPGSESSFWLAPLACWLAEHLLCALGAEFSRALAAPWGRTLRPWLPMGSPRSCGLAGVIPGGSDSRVLFIALGPGPGLVVSGQPDR